MVWYLYLSESPRSHLEIALSLTCSRSASWSCVMRRSVRSCRIRRPVLTLSTAFDPSFPLHYKPGSREKQETLRRVCKKPMFFRKIPKNRGGCENRRGFLLEIVSFPRVRCPGTRGTGSGSCRSLRGTGGRSSPGRKSRTARRSPRWSRRSPPAFRRRIRAAGRGCTP